MDTSSQLHLGHVLRLKDELEIVAKSLKKVMMELQVVNGKIDSAKRRKDALESDLERLMKVDIDVHVEHNVLAALDAPFDFEIGLAADWEDKTIHLRSALHQLLLMTVSNYRAAIQEQAYQEEDYAAKISDAIRARNLLHEEIKTSQRNAEEAHFNRIDVYESVKELESKIAACEAEIWLCRSDSNRLADQLTLISKEIRIPCGALSRGRPEKNGKRLRCGPITTESYEERFNFKQGEVDKGTEYDVEELGSINVSHESKAEQGGKEEGLNADLIRVIEKALTDMGIEAKL